MSEDPAPYSAERKTRPRLRQILNAVGTWSTLLLGFVAIALYAVGIRDLALVAVGLACFALSLAIRCYGMLTITATK